MTIIKLKRTKVGTATPALADGELFLDQLNSSVSWKDAAGLVRKLQLDLASTLVILALGQSNIRNEPAYAWTPARNLEIWNWDGTEAGVGTAFTACPTDRICSSWAFASEIARRNPNMRVVVIKIAFGGRPIASFIGGSAQKWRADTSATAPAPGEVKFNAATPSATTQITLSSYDTRGVMLSTDIANYPLAGNRIRIRNGAGGEAIFTATGNGTTPSGQTGYKTVPVTYVSSTGAFTDGDAVTLLDGVDIWSCLNANVAAALAVLGKSAVDLCYFWQIESNAADPSGWVQDRETLDAMMLATSWFPRTTQTLACGITTNAVTGNTAYGLSNSYVAAWCAADPRRRLFSSRYGLPQSLWDAASGYIHMTGEGYAIAGAGDAAALLSGGGTPVLPGVSTDYETQYVGAGGVKRPLWPLDVQAADPPQGIMAWAMNTVSGSALGSLMVVGGVGTGSYALGMMPSGGGFGIYSGTSKYGLGTQRLQITGGGYIGAGHSGAPGARAHFGDTDPANGVVQMLSNYGTGAGGSRTAWHEQNKGVWYGGIAPSVNAWHVTLSSQATAAIHITSAHAVGINETAPGARLSVTDSNPARGVISALRNSNSTSSTGAQLQLTAAGVGNVAIGIPAGATQALSGWVGRSTAADGTEVFRALSTAFNPGADNVFTLGASGARWSVVWADSATISTSDARAKSDIRDCPLGLDFVLAARPRMYEMIEGGATLETLETVDDGVEEYDAPVMRSVEREVVTREVVGDRVIERRAVVFEDEPVVDEMPVYDADGAPVMEIVAPYEPAVHDADGALISPERPATRRQKTIAVPRTEKRTRPRTTQQRVPRPGRRPHAGFVAQEIREVLAAHGVPDFAGLAQADPSDPDSLWGARYEEFIAPVYRAVQDLAARVIALERR